MFSLYFLGLLVTLFVLLYKYSTRKFDYWKKRNITEVKPIPFLGSISQILLMKTTIGEWLWGHYNKVTADYFGIFIFDEPILVVKSPKLVKAVLQKDFSNFQDRTIKNYENHPVRSNLMFFKKNPSWKVTRTHVTPIFSTGKLKTMFPLILHESQQLTDYLSKFANVPNFESKELAGKYSTNVIAKCAFAVDAGSFRSDSADFRSISRQLFGYRFETACRQIGSWFTPNLIRFFKIGFFDTKVLNKLEKILREVLNIRKGAGVSNGSNLIDMLLEMNRKKGENVFTDDVIVGHAVQFFIAGFETVSSTLSYTLYELAMNPDVQERLRAEILEHFERDKGITYEAVPEMKYLEMVICEALRKYPVLPFLDRMTVADYKVEGTDLVIQKGMAVYIPMFGLHHDPKYFPDPEKYDPERFADKSKINNNDGMFYVPFGEGPRICLGERFGMLGVKLGIIAILLKFKIERSSRTTEPLKFDPKSVVLQPKGGIPLTYSPL